MLYSIIITTRCNLACRYCYERIKEDAFLKEEMIPDVIQFIKRYQQEDIVISKEIIDISISGGEPLLCFDTVKNLVTSCKKASINSFQMSTNLTVANDDILDFMHRNNVRLHISIDGIEKAHDKNRVFPNRRGSFETVYKNIKKIRAKYPDWNNSYAMTVTPETVPYLYEGFRMLVDLGIRNIHGAYCVDSVWNEAVLEQYQREMRKIAKDYVQFYINNKRIYFRLLSNDIGYTVSGKKASCGACKNELAIMPNGDVLPCAAFVGQKGYESYVMGSLKGYVDFSKIKCTFFDRKVNVSECKGCELENRCHVDCFAVNYRATGSLYDVPDCCCALNKVSLLESENIIRQLSAARAPEFFKEFGRRTA